MTDFYKEQKKWPGLRDVNTDQDVSNLELENGVYYAAGIPRSMLKLYFPSKSMLAQKDSLQAQNREQLDVMNAMWEMALGTEKHLTMIVSGGNGTGKSWMGAALVHSMLRFKVCGSARYVNEGGLLLRSQSFEGTWFSQYTEVCQFLVLDEFGMTQWSPTDKRKIELILNARYSNGYPTVILTNRTPSELFDTTGGKEPVLSAQLRSRYSTGYRFRLTGPDMRRFRPDQTRDLPGWMTDPDDDPF